jgi:mono/diheme cytochrome c family protein
LEALARKIRPPVWPAADFGAIDEAKRKHGSQLYDQLCAGCHEHLAAGGKVNDGKMALDQIGTDPLRAENFARPVNQIAFDIAISDALKKVTRKAGGAVPDENQWRVTREYALRPLVASWATAPYLHNNSVPTIYDLLLPEEQRPSGFWVGHRDYDPEKLGYTTPAKDQQPPGRVWFDTTLPGNSNKGHSGAKFGTTLSDADRKDLLEYLKSVN